VTDEPQPAGKRGERGYRKRRPLGLAPWKPYAPTRPLVDGIDRVLAEYRDFWPLTVRQVDYRLIGIGVKLKTKRGADAVGDALNRGRRSGRWPWEAIRDEGAVRSTVGGGYDDPADFWRLVRDLAERYRRDLHVGQPRRVIVWCEAAGMIPQIERACEGLPVLVRSGSGMNSVTLLYEQAEESVADERPTVVLYIGDLDKWGQTIEDRLADDLAAFVEDLGGDLDGLRFQTIALTATQVEESRQAGEPLPENPETPGEYQAEALPPDVLARIVREAVEAEVDAAEIEKAKAEEDAEREAILDVLDGLSSPD
jgi:hypothetical protein